MLRRLFCLALVATPAAAHAGSEAEAHAACEHWLHALGATIVPRIATGGDEKTFFFNWKAPHNVTLSDGRSADAACLVDRQSGRGQLSIEGRKPVQWRGNMPVAPAQSPAR